MVLRLLLPLAVVLAGFPARAEPPPMAGAGVLERNGKRDCSAVLIAPDLIATAAHCAGIALVQAGGEGTVVFHTGAYPGHPSVARNAVEVMVHPLFRIAVGFRRLMADVAVMRLDAPVPAETALPLPLAPGIAAEESVLVASWPGGQGGRARERLCTALGIEPGLATLGCTVQPGDSGGAVVRLADSGPELVGIVAAKANDGRQPLAYVVQADRQLGQIRALYQLDFTLP